MKNKTKVIQIKDRKLSQYMVVCTKCEKEIVGTSETACLYNFKLHLEKCEKTKGHKSP